MTSMGPLRELGKRMASAQDRELDQLPALDTKQRLLASPDRRRRPFMQWIAAAAAVLLAGVVLVFWLQTAPSALEVTLSTGERAGVGRWLGANEAPLDLRFSDGTAVVLAPGSSARVASVEAKGARVVVERGFVDVAVAHVDGARWLFDVGPFTVRVTGTKFRAGWDPESSRFTLELKEGSVAVTGPVVGAERAVSKGEALRVSVGDARMELTSAAAPNETAIAEPAAPASVLAPAVELPEPPVRAAESSARSPASVPPPSSSATSEPAVETAPAPSWAELARAGEYKQAFARAEADGLDTILESATATELTLLADVARLAGDGAKATQILSTQRRRFKGDAQAAAAAFMLGRAAFDEQKAYASAAKWFATYLEEQPKGPFAREALGRLAEARHRAGDKAGARTAARAYLSAYPEGPHADVARSILAK